MRPDNPEQKIESRKQQEILKGFLGKEVVIFLRSGTKLKGKLESVSTYELVITVSYKPVVVLKHAVDYVELSD